MAQPDVHLPYVLIIKMSLGIPVFVQAHKFLDELLEFVVVEGGQLQVVGGAIEAVQVLVHLEELQLTSFLILSAAHPFESSDPVMQTGGGGLYIDGAIGHDLGLAPAFIGVEVDREHVISSKLPEFLILISIWLHQQILAQVNIQIFVLD